MANILEMANRRAEQSETWDSGVVVTYIWGAFGPLVFNVILRSFGVLVSKWLATRKRLAIERNGVKLGLRGSCNIMWGAFDHLVFKIIVCI